ncbi:NAD(P)-binding protein [Ramaria rubella]|nr:NAD(P)-binding protein [Ramaria rubella]
MSGRPILVLSSLDVWNISSNLPLPQLLETIHSALRSSSQSSETTQAPHRSTIHSPQFTTLFMPSRMEFIPVTSIKVVSVPKHGGQGGLPATTLVMDEETGCLDSVVNSRSLTALRTAAASTLATKLCLGSNANPTTLVLFGAGAQSRAHAAVLIAAYPQIRHCTVINRSYNGRLVNILDHFRAQFPAVEVVGLAGDAVTHGQSNTDIEQAVKSASIICTTTSSTAPLFPEEWVTPGTHINLIGSFTPIMHEVSSSLIKRAKIVIVDSRSACAKEAGELITAEYPMDKVVELGDLGSQLDTSASGEGEGSITIFKSVGVSVMDAAIASLVVRTAREVGSGISVPYD